MEVDYLLLSYLLCLVIERVPLAHVGRVPEKRCNLGSGGNESRKMSIMDV